MVQTEMLSQLADAKVAGLIDQTTGTWDPHILTDIFHPNGIPRILKIPISPEYEDTWYWYGDPNGCYSVKNGYRLMVGTYSTSTGFDKWNTLWQLKIPSKWKMFLWRAMSNILPTTTNLLIKRVEIDPTCSMCGLMHEDTMHSLVLCDYAKAIWSQSILPIPQIVTNVFYEWFGTLLNVLDSDAILFAAAILYNIWRARNEAVWNSYLPMPKKIVTTAITTMKAWQRVHATAEVDQPTAGMHGQQVPPTPLPVPPNSATMVLHPSVTEQPQLPESGVAVLHPPATVQLPPPGARNQSPQPRRCFIDVGYHPSSMTATAGAVLFTHAGDYI
ncbi:PREDICTED: uncharacterized protein LOC109164787 [Ipomoea nil]|uniref:uncharacterized protein LOC109164787 n=1 Tax=Ipomoea nil TaxID=35883 RepID=UPI000900D5B5|nr:PREDICTED: uncharacterized protein LOC109164787 [Ipomoea nil]